MQVEELSQDCKALQQDLLERNNSLKLLQQRYTVLMNECEYQKFQRDFEGIQRSSVSED